MALGVFVTRHAVMRYRERVRDLTDSEIVAALSGPTFLKAADFGAPYVKLGTGQHVIICGRRIVTVLEKGAWLGAMSTFSATNLKNARS